MNRATQASLEQVVPPDILVRIAGHMTGESDGVPPEKAAPKSTSGPHAEAPPRAPARDPDATGQQIGESTRGMKVGKRAKIAESVSAENLSQADAVTATSQASKTAFGGIGRDVPMPNGDCHRVNLDARTFDLYLLSRMRAAAAVQDALEALHAGSAEMAEALARVRAAGFEDVVLFAQRYIDVLGAPDCEEASDETHVEYRFGAARRLRFHRPPWPDVDFTVGADQNRCMFGIGFLRRIGVPTPKLESVADLSSWRFVRSEIAARFGSPRIGDAWSGWEDLWFEIPEEPNGATRRYLLRFDYDLLQDYSLDE